MGQIDITKMKAQDFMNELPEMVRSLEAVRSGSQDKKPVEITLGELVTGKWGISEDELFEKMGINPKNQLASSKSEKASNLLTKFVTMFHSMSWESIFVTLVFSWVMLWILWLWTWLSMVTTLMALSLPQ